MKDHISLDTFRDIVFDERAIDWLVPGILPARGLVLLYGPPGVGKTFIGLDLALTLAAGRYWAAPNEAVANKTRDRVSVLYWIGEGELAARRRVQAWYHAHKTDFDLNPELPFRFLGDRYPDMLLKPVGSQDTHGPWRRPLELLKKELQRDGVPSKRLFVVDTLAATHPSLEENAARDTGELIEACRSIIKDTDTTVLLIHHSGKNRGGGPRGHSRLSGDPDVVLRVSRLRAPHNNTIRLDIEKMRLQSAGPQKYFEIEPAEAKEAGTDNKSQGDAPRHEPGAILKYLPNGPKRITPHLSTPLPAEIPLPAGQRSLLCIAQHLADLFEGQGRSPLSKAALVGYLETQKSPVTKKRFAKPTIYQKLRELEKQGLLTRTDTSSDFCLPQDLLKRDMFPDKEAVKGGLEAKLRGRAPKPRTIASSSSRTTSESETKASTE